MVRMESNGAQELESSTFAVHSQKHRQRWLNHKWERDRKDAGAATRVSQTEGPGPWERGRVGPRVSYLADGQDSRFASGLHKSRIHRLSSSFFHNISNYNIYPLPHLRFTCYTSLSPYQYIHERFHSLTGKPLSTGARAFPPRCLELTDRTF